MFAVVATGRCKRQDTRGNLGRRFWERRTYGSPDDEIIPTNSDGEGGVDNAVAEFNEGAACWVKGGEFAEGLHDGESDQADYAEADDEGGGTARGEGAA